MIGRSNARGRDKDMTEDIPQQEELHPNAAVVYFDHRDRISELPDDVLDVIMSRVLLRDRITASVISRRWNEICLSPSRIYLNWHQGLVNVANCDRDEHFCPMYRDAFVNNVNRFLASLRGNHVHYFHLCFFLTSSSKDDIDEWIRFAVRRGVQVMGVVLCCRKGKTLRIRGADDSELSFEDDQYVIGTELFDTPQCNLTRLQLSGCNLRPDFAKHISSLKSLTLCFSFLAECDLETILSGLPGLMNLYFDRCSLPPELSLGCLPSPKTFRVMLCKGVEQIYLSNVKLTFLSIFGKTAIKCNLVGAPNLIAFGCSATSLTTVPCVFKRIPEEAPMLKKLCVSYHGQPDDGVLDCLKVFNGVTRLEWQLLQMSRLGIAKMISILKVFPLLEHLVVLMRNPESLEKSNHVMPVNYKPERLSYVELLGFEGASGQIDFVLYLLEHAVMLKKLVIVSAESWGEGARQDFLSKIQGLREDVEVIIT